MFSCQNCKITFCHQYHKKKNEKCDDSLALNRRTLSKIYGWIVKTIIVVVMLSPSKEARASMNTSEK